MWRRTIGCLTCALLSLLLSLTLGGCGGSSDATTDAESTMLHDVGDEATAPVDAVDADARSEGLDAAPAPSPFRVVIISDTHLVVPANHPNNQRFYEMGALTATLEPPPAFVVSTGDDVEDLFSTPEIVLAGGPLPMLERYAERVDEHFALPFYVTIGNHDNRFRVTFEPLLDVVWVDRRLHEAALDRLREHAQPRLSLVDARSFVVARREDVREVFGFECYFQSAGFTLL